MNHQTFALEQNILTFVKNKSLQRRIPHNYMGIPNTSNYYDMLGFRFSQLTLTALYSLPSSYCLFVVKIIEMTPYTKLSELMAIESQPKPENP